MRLDNYEAKRWINNSGKFYSIENPVVECEDGGKQYWIHNKELREI